jgi:thioredoxin-related protein
MVLFVALWLVVLLLTALVVGLNKRIVELSELVASGGLAPHGEGSLPGGPAVGSSVPFLFESLQATAERGLIVLFMEAGCSPCRKLGESLAARDMAVPVHPSFDLAVVTDDEGAAVYASVRAAHIVVQPDRELYRRLEVRGTPFGVVVDRLGTVRAIGIPNELADVVKLAEQAEIATTSSSEGSVATSRQTRVVDDGAKVSELAASLDPTQPGAGEVSGGRQTTTTNAA